MEKNENRYYDVIEEEKKVWTKRKPKKETEEEKYKRFLENKVAKRNKIIKYLLYTCVSVITTLIIFIQVRTVEETDLIGIKLLKSTELRTEILNERTKNKEYTKNIEELQKKIDEYSKSEIKGDTVPEVIEKELEETRIKLGLENVIGEGIAINLRDNEATVISANDILTLVNNLIISGAEAISINGNRVINTTDIVAINEKDILVNTKKIMSPYNILAIGNKKNLESGITTKDGYINQMSASGKSIDYSVGDSIEIQKSIEEIKFKYGRKE